MERSPPPLFKQGPSSFATLTLFLALALGLLLIDARYDTLRVLRTVIGNVLYPFEQLALMPGKAAGSVIDFMQSNASMAGENTRLRREHLEAMQQVQRAAQLSAENAALRRLLNLNQATPVRTVAAEIQYSARDPYTQRVIIDRGTQHDIRPGLPVIDERGVVGQVTRVFAMHSEVTLLTDKDQSIPVQVVRNGLRSVAYGGSKPGMLDLRFMATSSDLQVGDALVTSGLDNTYPPGLPVAQIVQVERKADTAFARVICAPTAGLTNFRHVLVLLYEANPPPPVIETDTKDSKGRGKGRAMTDAAQDGNKENRQEGGRP